MSPEYAPANFNTLSRAAPAAIPPGGMRRLHDRRAAL